MASVLGFLRHRAVELAVRSGSALSLVWFLYQIGYGLVALSEPLVRVNFVNCVGAVVSLAVVFAGFRLGVKKVAGTPRDGQREEQKMVVEQASFGEEAPMLEQGDEEEQPSLPRGLEEEESSLTQEKQGLLTLEDALGLEPWEKVEVRRRNVDALKDKVADLKRQVDELKMRLQAMQ
jgi:hypothetical protein